MSEVDFGWINTRVRGMRRYLLKESQYDSLLKNGKQNPDSILHALNKTQYKKTISRYYLRSEPTESFTRALFASFGKRIGVVRKLVGKDYEDYIKNLLLKWDIHILKIAIRAINNGIPFDEKRRIPVNSSHCLPIGEFDSEDLSRIFTSASITDILTLLREKKSLLIKPLENLVKEKRIIIIESALDQFYFSKSAKFLNLKEDDDDVACLKQVLTEEIDFHNVITFLRWLKLKNRESMGDLELEELFFSGGKRFNISEALEAVKSTSSTKILSVLKKAGYGKLTDINLVYTDFKPDKVDYEFILEKQFFKRMMNKHYREFESFNFLVSYYYSLLAELRNLRTINYGIYADLPIETISSRLII